MIDARRRHASFIHRFDTSKIASKSRDRAGNETMITIWHLAPGTEALAVTLDKQHAPLPQRRH